MSIKRHGNKWRISHWVRFRPGPDGRRMVWRDLDGSLPESVVRAQDKVFREASHGAGVTREDTVAEAFNTYIAWARKNVTAGTLKDITRTFTKEVIPRLGRVPIVSLSNAHLRSYQQDRSKTVGNRTVNKEVSYIYMLIKYCQSVELIPQDKVVRIRPLAYTQPVAEPLSPDELRALLNAAQLDEDQNVYPALLMFAYMGLRRTELLEARAENVNETNATIRITRKGGKDQILELPPVVLEAIRPLLGRTGYLFESQRGPRERGRARKGGHPYYSFRKAIIRAAQAAGISRPVYHHLLRHSFATILADAGEDVATVAQILGHKTLAMAAHYSANAKRLKKIGIVAKVVENNTERNIRPS